jgi:hypothetical protein
MPRAACDWIAIFIAVFDALGAAARQVDVIEARRQPIRAQPLDQVATLPW